MNRFWLTHDLRDTKVYEPLYKWLVNVANNTVECGGTSVSFTFKGNLKKIKESLIKEVPGIENERIYMIYKNDENAYEGSFIWGKRNAVNPWDRYAVIDDVVDKEV